MNSAGKTGATQLNAIQVRQLEWEAILRTRATNHRPAPPKSCSEWNRGLVGLALSGGGIRGATFHLGILQALAEKRMLSCFDYISSVSGGGFIAGWFCKLIHTRALKNGVDAVKSVSARLSPRAGRESAEVHWLRRHLTYLTPQGGLFAQSSWLFGATYLHNLAINFSVLWLALAAVLIAPRAVLATLYYVVTSAKTQPILPRLAGDAAAVLIFGAILLVMSWLVRHRRRSKKPTQRPSHLILTAIACAIVLGVFLYQVVGTPLVPDALASVLLAVAYHFTVRRFWDYRRTSARAKNRFLVWTSLCGAFLAFAWYFVAARTFSYQAPLEPYRYCWLAWEWLASHMADWLGSTGLFRRDAQVLGEVLAIVSFAAILAGCCFLLSTRHINRFARWEGSLAYDVFKFAAATVCVICLNAAGVEVLCAIVGFLKSDSRLNPQFFVGTIVVGVPLLAACVAFSFNLLIALLGRIVSHHIRLEIAALSTILYRYAFMWATVSAIALYGPVLLYATGRTTHVEFWLIWTVSGLVGFVVRRDPRIRFDALRHVATAMIGVVPYIFFLCYVLFVAFSISAYVYAIGWTGSDRYWIDVVRTMHPGSLVLTSTIAFLVFLLSARFGVNSPSMHMFYQWRIADAYLNEVLPGGEAATEFMNSAGEDSGLGNYGVRMQELCKDETTAYNGPYLLLNAALNLVSSDEPAWQDRRAANFLFSPLFSGYEPARVPTSQRRLSKNAYRRTAEYRYGEERGVRLAQAMSISGSAIGSSMGYHSSPRVRFLHTILNVRLGWWFANPRFPGSWEGKAFRSRIGLLLSELAGRTHDHGPVVHLSDGGHFENLGVYELIRRRCRLIVVSDASEDHLGYVRALGNAIERCRTDFGIEIELDVSKLTAQGSYAANNVAIGRVLYGVNRLGVIIYVRPVLTGREPADLLSYGRLHSRFPNESTANQWFKESQFESYRRLGLFAGRRAAELIEKAGGPDRIVSVPERAFETITP
jgi:Patatin-like phospholipase